MFALLARSTYRHRWLWLALGALALAFGIFYGTHVFATLKDGGLGDPASPSAVEASVAAEKFPRSQVSLILLAESPALTVDQPAYRKAFESVVSSVATDPSSPLIDSYYSTSASDFVSRDRHETFALISIPGTDRQRDAAYLRILARMKEDGLLKLELGGPTVADHELNAEVQRDLPRLGAISLPLLAILLLIIFRSAIAAVLPLMIGAISVLGAFAITRALSAHVDISIFATNIIGLLGLGLAIDYSLLYVSRFRDELADGKSVEGAIAMSTHTAGESIFLSGTTVALSLLGLLVFPEMFLRSMGLGGALAVVVAVIASLTVLPAILSILGPAVDRLTVPLPHTRPGFDSNRAWRRLGQFVVRFPIPMLVVTLGLLLWAGAPFLHVRYANPGAQSLPPGFAARLVADRIDRDFGDGQDPTVEVVVTLPASPVSATQLANLSTYVQTLAVLPGVHSISGLIRTSGPLTEADQARFLAGDLQVKVPASVTDRIDSRFQEQLSAGLARMDAAFQAGVAAGIKGKLPPGALSSDQAAAEPEPIPGQRGGQTAQPEAIRKAMARRSLAMKVDMAKVMIAGATEKEIKMRGRIIQEATARESSVKATISDTAQDRLRARSKTALKELKKRYVSGDLTLITVDCRGAETDPATLRLIQAIRTMAPPDGSSVLVGGRAAELADRLDSLRQHLPEALALIFLTTFVVMMVMLWSLAVPVKAIALNTLSLAAAFGLMTWIFQDGHLHRVLRFTPSGSLDPTLPVLIFAIAFGLATDYEVFLVSRIKEEYERTASNTAAVVIGVEKTGGIITSAGLLLVVVVAAFGFSDILPMKEMGVGLAVAVAVDAAIVRTLLVPAAMQLFGRLNWWMPGERRLPTAKGIP